MSKPRKRLDPLASIANSALRVAATRVFERWQDESAELVSAQDVTFELLALCRAIEAPQAESLETSADSATSVLRARLIGEIQGELLKEWSGTAEAVSTEMVRILAGIEHVKTSIEPPSADGLANRLADPGGLELVVEVAHDLRSPLTSILFLAETLLRGGSGAINDVQKRQLGIVYSAALGLISTASDVVELARGGDRQDAEPVPFSLAGLIGPVRDLVQPMALEKGVEIRLETPADDHRFGLPVPLSRVLLNLTTNALKFTETGFIDIIGRKTTGDRVEFSVRDSGCGIDADELPTMFYPFKRRSGPGSGYHFSGTGLGLTICRKLVRNLNGELQVESAPGWGTRFFFEIDLPTVRRA